VSTEEIENNKNPKADLIEALTLLFKINNRSRAWGRSGMDMLSHTSDREQLEALLIKNGIEPK